MKAQGRDKWLYGLVSCAALANMAWAGTVQDGGRFLNDFELVGRWQCRPNGGYINCNDLAFVTEGGTGYLYAHSRSGGWAVRKCLPPTPGPGVRNVTEVGNRPGSQQALAYFPNYAGGTLCSHDVYFSTGWGYGGGSDSNIITAEPGDTNLYDTGKTFAWYYYNSGGTFLPTARSLTGNDGFIVVRNGGGAPFQALMWLEVDTTPNPDQWKIPQLPGRGTGDDDRSVLMNLTSQLGIQSATSAEFCDYSVFKAQATLYILANGAGDTYHLFALTPGPDGKFGETTPGVCDDEAVGYTFGEPGAGNTYQVQRRRITWENAPGDTTLVDIDGSYNTGYRAAAYDPATGYIYLHGGGDYANGIIIKDISKRSKAPPLGTVVKIK
ncbi:MAG: hypothetical protein N2255_10900 [Kiritimatiellae bacterium]|nr:hypothetical protein [Kiritimatiellia bacterium]